MKVFYQAVQTLRQHQQTELVKAMKQFFCAKRGILKSATECFMHNFTKSVPLTRINLKNISGEICKVWHYTVLDSVCTCSHLQKAYHF